MNEGLNFFMHREYVRSELKDDQTCEPQLPITFAASGFVQQIARANFLALTFRQRLVSSLSPASMLIAIPRLIGRRSAHRR